VAPAPRPARTAAARLSPLRDDLAAAYRAATYRLELADGALDLRIGEPSPRLDAFLAAAGTERAAIVTAENPGSRPLPAAENASRTERLGARLAAAGARVVAAESRAADGGWRERSFLVLGLEEAAAVELGRAFDQAAIVVCEHARPPRLVAVRARG
jgi:hypothetical protein